MTSIVIRDDRLTEEQEELEEPRSRLPSTKPTTNVEGWDYGTHGSTGGPGEHCWRRTGGKGDRRWSAARLHSGISWVLLCVLTPALIISVLRAVCSASAPASTNRAAGNSPRRLSDDGESNQEDSTLSQLIEECAALEAELGLPLTEESSPAQDLDAAEQVARIAQMLYQEGVAFEMQQTQQAVHSSAFPLTLSPAILEGPDQYQYVQGAEHTPGPQLAVRGPQHATSARATSHLQPIGVPPEILAASPHTLGGTSQPAISDAQTFSAHPSPVLWTPQGLFASPQPGVAGFQSVKGPQPAGAAIQPVGLLSQAPSLLPKGGALRSSKEKRRKRVSRKPYAGVDTDSWLDVVPVDSVSPERRRQSKASFPQGLLPEQAASTSGGARTLSAETEPVAAGQSSSTEGVSGEAFAVVAKADAVRKTYPASGASESAAASLQADWICRHPYVRLPHLQEGVLPPPIRLSPSNFESNSDSSVPEILLCLRDLFMRESLNQKEVTLLVGYVQELAIASAARERATKRMDYAFHGMINIGRQFLVLDAIVSALHVLGVPPLSCSWWEAFATCFDTDYRYAEPGPRAQESGKVNVDLANRMLVAMSIYKTGNRPNPEEILDMKRTLFFSPHMAFFFKRRRWDIWRTDSVMFEKENPPFF